jgi:hypothetical protein
MMATIKRAMGEGLGRRVAGMVLAGLLSLYAAGAKAGPAADLEQTFSDSLTAVPSVRGGTGANFVVDWAATGEIAEPVVEALMVGGLGSGHYAFISQGRPMKIMGKN